jgi:hypothetical protein
VRRHIAHASKVLSMPVTMVKIPIMRFTFVSIDSDEAVAEESARLWLICSVMVLPSLGIVFLYA